MAVVAMKQLLQEGVHSGNPTIRCEPKIAGYMFHARKRINRIT